MAESVFENQKSYIAGVKELARAVYKEPKACVITFGCQQNVSDSEHYKGMLEAMGYAITEDETNADFVLFNTCAVREHAQDRVFGNVGTMKALKKARPDMIVAVSGCMPQQQAVADKIKKSYPYVDMVLGTQVMHKFPELLYKRLSGSPRIFDISVFEKEIVEGIPVHRDKTVKGWLPIMYGCNNFCTYCIVPFVRGRERSRASKEILAEAKSMIEAGIKDITLLGQNVNSYGKTLDEDINFAKLLEKINALDGDFRIRFMTSHPKDCTEELLETMSRCKKVAHHLHLPVQSGSDRVLKAMNRHYDSERYKFLIKKAKELMPDITITSDIIVGFPGETYEEFCDTKKLVGLVEYDSLFTFIYSPRPNTPAAEMEDNISRSEKGKWFNELILLQDKIGKEKLKNMQGREFEVLCEEKTEDGYILGRTTGTQVIKFKGEAEMLGKFVKVKVTDVSDDINGIII